jgi:hypothetical protein
MKRKLRALFLCLPLLMGSLLGAPMRPEQIEELMRAMSQQKIVRTVADDNQNDDDTIRKLPDEGV